MITIYDPVSNHYKIEVDRMGHFTVTRQKRGAKYFDPGAVESRYLQFEEDTATFETDLKAIQVMPSNKRNWAYTELINSQFE